MKFYYYEVHVIESIHEGRGVPIKSEKELDDGEAIALAISLGRITEDEVVDYVEPIDESEYLESGIDITGADVLHWHGSDHGIDELAEVLADILNGDYPLELAKKEIGNY